jgi:hypothetical protein
MPSGRRIDSCLLSPGKLWWIPGWAAIFGPMMYMMFAARDSGEHGGTVILVGVGASAFQICVWGPMRVLGNRVPASWRRVSFGSGAPLSLVCSVFVLAVSASPAAAAMTYIALSVSIAIVALRMSDRLLGGLVDSGEDGPTQ